MINPATSDVDFDPNINSVTQPATMGGGMFTLTANVTVIDDTILEFDEEFTVFLDSSDPPFGVMIVSAQDTTTITLGDDGRLSYVARPCSNPFYHSKIC